jgi:predicted site-specific integrase-resolvase
VLAPFSVLTSQAGKGASDLQQQQRRASGRPAYSAIEADMDRLFARKVVVYDRVSLGDSTEAVLNTVLKVRRLLCLVISRTLEGVGRVLSLRDVR